MPSWCSSKKRRDGSIKARGCADSRPQWEYTTKAETSSTTISSEDMMMACAIDAKEGKYVAVTPRCLSEFWHDCRFNHGTWRNNCQTDHKLVPKLYRKYVWENKHSKPILYVKLKRRLMVPYRLHYYSSNCYPRHLQNGASN